MTAAPLNAAVNYTIKCNTLREGEFYIITIIGVSQRYQTKIKNKIPRRVCLGIFQCNLKVKVVLFRLRRAAVDLRLCRVR